MRILSTKILTPNFENSSSITKILQTKKIANPAHHLKKKMPKLPRESVDPSLRAVHFGPDLLKLPFQPRDPTPRVRDVGFQQIWIVLGAQGTRTGTHCASTRLVIRRARNLFAPPHSGSINKSTYNWYAMRRAW